MYTVAHYGVNKNINKIKYRVSTWSKLKVCHNDIFRSLLNVPRFHSASSLLVDKRVNNMDVIIRRNVLSLKTRIIRMVPNNNTLCMAFREREARVHSPIWKHLDMALRGNAVELYCVIFIFIYFFTAFLYTVFLSFFVFYCVWLSFRQIHIFLLLYYYNSVLSLILIILSVLLNFIHVLYFNLLILLFLF